MAIFSRALGRGRGCAPRSRRCLQMRQPLTVLHARHSSSSDSPPNDTIKSILSKPTWSVQSLLPDSSTEPQSPTVTPEQLQHLLRLSALPQPSHEKEEKDMLQTLQSQIHFVKEIQLVDTDGVAPLRSIRDENDLGRRNATIDVDEVESTLAREERVGRRGKIRRAKVENPGYPDGREERMAEDGKRRELLEEEARAGDLWDGDALQAASKTEGRYFVVQSSNND